MLINGSRIHISGRTSIDYASIHAAKIMDATNSAKIASLDTGKISTGILAATHIAAESKLGRGTID